MSDITPTTPIDSATVIFIRDCNESQYEIYLMRRSDDLDFMGGAHVFPGGALEDEDCDPELPACTVGFERLFEKLKSHETGESNEKISGLIFAAIRETFEESGILIAYDENNKIVNFENMGPEYKKRFVDYRSQIYNKSITLTDIARKENIKYALDYLSPFSHWITPETAKGRRYSARFFIVIIPPGQIPVHDNIEMTESSWITPNEALERFRQGKISLMPPTFRTVEELNGFKSAEGLLSSVPSRIIYPILPQFFKFENGYGIKLPHDPEYTIEDYKMPERHDEPSRIVIEDGIMKSQKKYK